MKLQIPPIKCQRIKTKLVSLIKEMADWDSNGTWIEPFTGSGVVGFNLAPKRAIFADTNPHTIAFFKALQGKSISPCIIREHLVREGAILALEGESHYYAVRERFNSSANPLDFLFLNRSCFNGVMRFNRKGGFNVPFCRKPDRFAPAYITKIVNQAAGIYERMQNSDWEFVLQDFDATIGAANLGDFIYADPPYIGRHVDYFDGWDESKEARLFALLSGSPARFMLSTWEENSYRRNTFIDSLWGIFPRVTEDHFYHVSAKEANRSPMKEALVMNYAPPDEGPYRTRKLAAEQVAMLFEARRAYRV